MVQDNHDNGLKFRVGQDLAIPWLEVIIVSLLSTCSLV